MAASSVSAAEDVAHELLRGRDRKRSRRFEMLKNRRDRLVEALGRNDMVHEPDRFRAVRIEAFARDEERTGIRDADLRENVRRDDGRNDAEFDFGEPEEGVVGGDGDVGHGGEPAAAAERRALNARYDRFATAVDRDEHARKRLGIVDIFSFVQV